MSTNNITPHEMAHENLYNWTSAEEMHAATGLTLAECHEIMHEADVSRALGNVEQLCDMAASEPNPDSRHTLMREAVAQLATLHECHTFMRDALASAEASPRPEADGGHYATRTYRANGVILTETKPHFYTPRDAAAVLGVSERTATHYAQTGILKAWKGAGRKGRWHIYPEAVETLKRERGNNA